MASNILTSMQMSSEEYNNNNNNNNTNNINDGLNYAQPARIPSIPTINNNNNALRNYNASIGMPMMSVGVTGIPLQSTITATPANSITNANNIGGPINPMRGYSIPGQGTRITSIPYPQGRIPSIPTPTRFLSRIAANGVGTGNINPLSLVLPMQGITTGIATGLNNPNNPNNNNQGYENPQMTTSNAAQYFPFDTNQPIQPMYTTSTAIHPALTTTTLGNSNITNINDPNFPAAAYATRSRSNNNNFNIPMPMGPVQTAGYYYNPVQPEQTLSVLSLSGLPQFQPNLTVNSYGSIPQIPQSAEAQAFYANLSTLNALTRTTVSIPLESFTQNPIFVSSSQYQQIIKRRALRLKEQRLNKNRGHTKVKHLSRQLHAARRIRGQGGRFLTKAEREALLKQQQEQQLLQPLDQQGQAIMSDQQESAEPPDEDEDDDDGAED